MSPFTLTIRNEEGKVVHVDHPNKHRVLRLLQLQHKVDALKQQLQQAEESRDSIWQQLHEVNALEQQLQQAEENRDSIRQQLAELNLDPRRPRHYPGRRYAGGIRSEMQESADDALLQDDDET